jgi:hypothetical protein
VILRKGKVGRKKELQKKHRILFFAVVSVRNRGGSVNGDHRG